MTSFPLTRLVLVGRRNALAEVVLHGWPDAPRTGSLLLKKIGPVPASSVKVLVQEAEYLARHMGYHADTFFIGPDGPGSLVAWIPAGRCVPGGADEALRQIGSW